MNGDQTQALLDGLDRLAGTAGEYRGFLSNHGPMALDAMVRLGGTDHAGSWADRYRHDLEPAPTPAGVDLGGDRWRTYLGAPPVEGDWVEYFARSIADQGWGDTLATWWPRLLPGVAASAAHGLLRTAHAVRNLAEGLDQHPLVVNELVQGLALWASRYQQLPGDPRLDGSMDLEAAVRRLPRLDRTAPSRGPGIAGRLTALSTLNGFAAGLDRWGTDAAGDAVLDELIDFAAGVVLSHRDNPIAYCHAVTAPAAVRMILPSIPVEHHAATVAGCWQIVGALLAAFDADADGRSTPPSDSGAIPHIDELRRAAAAHGDEHVIKLTEACLRQYADTGDTTLLAAAAAYRHRITLVGTMEGTIDGVSPL